MKLADFLDLDWDDGDNTTVKTSLPYNQQKMLDRHNNKKDRLAFRQSEKKRREKEEQLFDPEYGERKIRYVPKSVVGYKPMKWPMIRFGKFRERSSVGFDAEMRREMGNITHEIGVSCFRSMEYKGGFLILEHAGESSWAGGYSDERMLVPWLRQMKPQYDNYLKTGTPMDIFLIYGNMCATGKNKEWLEIGADGEYLLNTRLPYKQDHLAPNKLWINHLITLDNYYKLYLNTR